MALQHVSFGLSFKADDSIDDHRQFFIPNNVNRLMAINMEDKPMEQCVEALKRVLSIRSKTSK